MRRGDAHPVSTLALGPVQRGVRDRQHLLEARTVRGMGGTADRRAETGDRQRSVRRVDGHRELGHPPADPLGDDLHRVPAGLAPGEIGQQDDELLATEPPGEIVLAHLVLHGPGHRREDRVAGSSYFDLSSVWTFAAAALLRPALAAVVIGGLYAHLWVRVWRPARVPLYRHVYTTATVVLAAFAAHHLLAAVGGAPGWPDDLAGLGSVALAVLGYGAVNTVLVAAAILLSNGRGRVSETLGHWDDNVLELGTLSLGALAAIALVTNPWLVVLVLPPLLVLHRAVLVRQLEEAASTDGKTGLLTAAAWHARAVSYTHLTLPTTPYV